MAACTFSVQFVRRLCQGFENALSAVRLRGGLSERARARGRSCTWELANRPGREQTRPRKHSQAKEIHGHAPPRSQLGGWEGNGSRREWLWGLCAMRSRDGMWG
eukprot:1296474-Rhodomonas_salina.2